MDNCENPAMKVRLAVNTGFALNRYQNPEAWGRAVSCMGLHAVQITAGVINPFWDKDYVEALFNRTREAAKRYEFTIESAFTDALTRMSYLATPDERGRRMWVDWYKRYFALTARLGAHSCGSHFGSMSTDDCADPEIRARRTDDAVALWQELTFAARDEGMDCLIFEPMSVPREFAYTIALTRELMDRVNAHCGVPLKICLDVGHAPHPEERDAYRWIRALGADSPVIHLQQTQLGRSNHWPFTPEYNAQGYITAPRVLETLKEAGCRETLLALELSHREHWDTDDKVLEDHIQSVRYWRQYVAD